MVVCFLRGRSAHLLSIGIKLLWAEVCARRPLNVSSFRYTKLTFGLLNSVLFGRVWPLPSNQCRTSCKFLIFLEQLIEEQRHCWETRSEKLLHCHLCDYAAELASLTPLTLWKSYRWRFLLGFSRCAPFRSSVRSGLCYIFCPFSPGTGTAVPAQTEFLELSS